ncbi:MAG: hypothetical protein ACU0AT_07865 [Tranquillimonas sp.]
MILRNLLLAATAAMPAMAAAQDTASPEGLTALGLDTCLVTRLPHDFSAPAGFAPAGEDGKIRRFDGPGGVTLAVTQRDGFYSCEMTVPNASAATFDEMMAAASPRIQAMIDAADFEQVEDGQVWQSVLPDDVAVTVKLQRQEDGTITLTSSTETTQAPAAPRASD